MKIISFNMSLKGMRPKTARDNGPSYEPLYLYESEKWFAP